MIKIQSWLSYNNEANLELCVIMCLKISTYFWVALCFGLLVSVASYFLIDPFHLIHYSIFFKVASLAPGWSHYSDVIMSVIASQITGVYIDYSTVCSGAEKTSKVRVTGLCAGNSSMTGEFLAQRTSNAENISIWWRHRAMWSPRCQWSNPEGYGWDVQ